MASIAQADPNSAELKQRIERFQSARDNIIGEVRKVIVGQEEVIDQVLTALFVGGHCLITGLPGTAKTLMVRTIAQTLGLVFKRIQFTPDLMPADITGTDIIEEDPTTGHRRWTFIPGPLFGNILLADEVNRTPPKTQSALLEAMQELSCTVRGNHYKLPAPFFVLATQNPIELEGTYPLPEAQLDRFLFNTVLDYLSAEDELKVIDLTTTTHTAKVETVTNAEEILDFQALVRMVPIAESVAHYVVRLGSRHPPQQRRRPGHRQEVRELRRQRARRAVHCSRGQGPRALPPPLPCDLRGRHLAGHPGAPSPHPAQFPCRIRPRRFGRNPATADRADAAAQGLKVTQRFLNPDVLAGISGLELIAKTVVQGFVSGLHRSPNFGFSQEFAEYRSYTPGDDLRYVDWNVYARTDRFYLKRYRGETNTLLTVLLDASNSMKYASHAVSKMDYARYIAASLFYLAIHSQRDAAGLIVFDDELRDYIRPSTRQGQLHRLLAALERAEPRARTDFAKPILHFQEMLRRRGFVVLISDFYDDPDKIVRTVEPMRFHGNEVLFFHVLDPQEIRPKLREPMTLIDLETDEALEVTPDYAHHDYREKMDAHLKELADRVRAAGMEYYLLVTDRPLDGALREFLTLRQGRL